MALTLEALFDAYETGDDFAEQLYGFFGLDKGGIGAKEFSDKYSMYIPTYDPTEERFAAQDKYLAFRNAGETHNLSKAMTEELYSTEMENVSGALGKEVAKGKQMAGQLGLRSGTLESAMEETMDLFGGKAKSIGRQYDLKEQGDLDAYNIKMVDATLDYEKDEHQIKQDYYDKVMASIARVTELGAFDPEEDAGCMLDCGHCEAPLECNACTGECQIMETPPGWETQMGPCTEGMLLAGCVTQGDSCFCEGEVVANQEVTTTVDAVGCVCSYDLEGRVINCQDSSGNSCTQDTSTQGSWCDQHNDDCNDPASCKYPCGIDLDEEPSDFTLDDGWYCQNAPQCCSYGVPDETKCGFDDAEAQCATLICVPGEEKKTFPDGYCYCSEISPGTFN